MTEPGPVSVTAARDLVRTLVETPSLSGHETECAEALAGFLEAHDREAWIDDAGNVRAPGRDAVLLTSHIDTVPGSIPVRVEDDTLWGRGSVDAKGPLAALAAAAVNSGASFVGVTGEEDDSRGARHLVEDRRSPDALVNGEPSGWDNITLGYRGSLAGTYIATSESGHTSRPENNAIQDAIEWYARVEAEFESDEWTPVTERVTPKPTRFDGGLSDDGLSVEADMDVQLRVPTELTVAEVRERANAQIESGTVRWFDEIPPVLMSPRTDLARAFRVAIRDHGGDPTPLTKTGTSDMNLYAEAWDCPMVTYGPGDSDLDHTPEERLSLAEFDSAVRILTEVSSALTA